MINQRLFQTIFPKLTAAALSAAVLVTSAGCGAGGGTAASGQTQQAETVEETQNTGDGQAQGKEDAEEGGAAGATAAETAAAGAGAGDRTDDDASGGDSAAAAAEIEIPENPYHRDDGGVSLDVFAMDTYMSLLAYGDRAEEAVVAAAAEIHSLDDMLSTGDPASVISQLNAAGGGEVPGVVLQLIEESQTLYRETDGLFDIAIYPVMKLWGFPSQDYHVPEKTELAKALKLADPSAIRIEKTGVTWETGEKASGEAADRKTAAASKADTAVSAAAAEGNAASSPDAAGNAASADTSASAAAADPDQKADTAETGAAEKNEEASGEAEAAGAPAGGEETGGSAARVSFGIPGMEIDLGGIAKGYTSSRVMEIYREYGIEHGLVSLGGNVQALGTKENGKPWRVAIQNPQSDQDYLGVLDIDNKCVITSGGYERYFEQDGVRYHHIIDPRTGFPADSGIISSTIISEDGTLADGLSTSLFIMGKERAEKFWRDHPGRFDYILEDADGTLYVTEGAAELLTTDAETRVIK